MKKLIVDILPSLKKGDSYDVTLLLWIVSAGAFDPSEVIQIFRRALMSRVLPVGTCFKKSRSPAEREKGVSACSAGNHGLGVAYGAQKLKIPCTLFVPKSVDRAKYQKLLALGATVHISEFIGYDDTLARAHKQAALLGLPLISAFDDERIMAANGGTLAVEVAAQLPEASHFVLPMGGGGLAAGFSWYVKSINPRSRITVCQLAECPALMLSMKQGNAVTYMPPIDTLAGGLEGGLGEKCYSLLASRVDEIAHSKESELKSVLCWLLEHHQILIEPSSAVALAVSLYGHVRPKGPLVIVLTGRNVSYSTLQQLMAEKS